MSFPFTFADRLGDGHPTAQHIDVTAPQGDCFTPTQAGERQEPHDGARARLPALGGDGQPGNFGFGEIALLPGVESRRLRAFHRIRGDKPVELRFVQTGAQHLPALTDT